MNPWDVIGWVVVSGLTIVAILVGWHILLGLGNVLGRWIYFAIHRNDEPRSGQVWASMRNSEQRWYIEVRQVNGSARVIWYSSDPNYTAAVRVSSSESLEGWRKVVQGRRLAPVGKWNCKR